MGTHPIFESDFDCLTDFVKMFSKIVRTTIRSLSTATRSAALLQPARLTAPSVRFVSPAPKTIQEVSDIVFYVLSTFDKIDTDKLSLDVRFDKDLGLDSLDTTEICMHGEDEFLIEITVEQADYLLTPREMIDFLCDRMDIIDYTFTYRPFRRTHSPLLFIY